MTKLNDGLQVVNEMVMFYCEYSTEDYIRVCKDSNGHVTVEIVVSYGEEVVRSSVTLNHDERDLMVKTIVEYIESIIDERPFPVDKETVICPESAGTKFEMDVKHRDFEIHFSIYGNKIILGVIECLQIRDMILKDLSHVHISERKIGGTK